MIEVLITSQMMERAKHMAQQLGHLNNSIRAGAGNLCGFLGELAFLKTYPDAEHVSEFSHDIMLRGKRIEIKTSERNVRPQLTYNAVVSSHNPNQLTDYYVFASLLNKTKRPYSVFLVGFISREDFYKKASLKKMGEINGEKGFSYKCDTWSMLFKDLTPISQND